MTCYEWLVKAVTEHDSDECLLWPFSATTKGYGHLSATIDGEYKSYLAHRIAFKIANGRWPEPLGLHTCDTPRCFNPRHIFEGSYDDNSADQVAKDRQVKGEMQVHAKLTEAIVADARREYAQGRCDFRFLANKYGVGPTRMRMAVTGQTWKHVPGAVDSRMGIKAFCKHGHKIDGANVHISGKRRRCKTCLKNGWKKVRRHGE